MPALQKGPPSAPLPTYIGIVPLICIHANLIMEAVDRFPWTSHNLSPECLSLKGWTLLVLVPGLGKV